MDGKIRILIAILVVALVALIIWAVTTTPDAPPPIQKIDPPPTMEYEGNTITEEKNGEKLFEINSGKMIIDTKTENADFQDIVVKFYHPDGRTLELNAKQGNYNQQSGDIHVEGDVVVTSSDGAKLTSDKLDWNGNTEIIKAIGNVKIFKNDMQAYADNAEATNGLRHFKLKGNARVIRGVKN